MNRITSLSITAHEGLVYDLSISRFLLVRSGIDAFPRHF